MSTWLVPQGCRLLLGGQAQTRHTPLPDSVECDWALLQTGLIAGYKGSTRHTEIPTS